MVVVVVTVVKSMITIVATMTMMLRFTTVDHAMLEVAASRVRSEERSLGLGHNRV